MQLGSDYRTHAIIRCGFYIFYPIAVARSKNPGGLVVLSGDNVAPLVEIGLTDLPKTGGGAKAPPAPPLATGLGGNHRRDLSDRVHI